MSLIYFIFVLILDESILNAQTSSNYTIVKSSISQGGGVSNSTNYEMVDVAGSVTPPGNATSENYRVNAGFLPGTTILTEVEKLEVADLPTEFKLFQNYPNPFNPVTTIEYSVKNNSNVLLKIYDILGREVVILVNENHQPGFYKVSFDSKNLASGVYFYNIRMDDFKAVKKMSVLK
jgi:hypothetical protein